MKKNLPEIVFSSSDSTQSQRISRLVKSGLLRKICPRVYTSNHTDDDKLIISRNLYSILGHLFPRAILSHRSAMEGRPTDSGDIFLSYIYTKQIKLPGMCVHLMKGPAPTETDLQFLHNLFISSKPRCFLENLQISRSRSHISKNLPQKEIEDRLERICQIHGVDALCELRSAANKLSKPIKMEIPFKKLTTIIGAILKTRPASNILTSQAALARAMGQPYDPIRLDIFNNLFSELTQTELPSRKELRKSSEETQLLSFFEAYFSNYIEGTEFEIVEAYDIIFRNKTPRNRPEDAHDIMGTFRVAAGLKATPAAPESFTEFLDLLKSRHHDIMESRSNRMPGQFKEEPNRAGETHFVAPELVQGTLLKGFEMISAITPGLPRAIFIMFIIAEVHPFMDGNGRVARLMMNAELINAGLSRIILPTVFRDDYLLALRTLSRSSNPAPLVKAMDYVQRFTSQLSMSSYETAIHALTKANAFKDPEEARLKI